MGSTMSIAVTMTPGTTGWIVTLDCGHTRSLAEQPNGPVRCWTCETSGEIRRERLEHPAVDITGRSTGSVHDVARALNQIGEGR